jgi:hypothetical protein
MTDTPADQPDDGDANPPPTAEGLRFRFTVMGWWLALTDMHSGIATGEILQQAVATAAGLPNYAFPCIVCQQPFSRLVAPASVLFAQPLASNATGSIGLICGQCWHGKWDDDLKAALHREFGVPPDELQPLHQAAGHA